MRRIREQGHRVADFNILPELIEHARKEGATHADLTNQDTAFTHGTNIYFPHGDRYAVARVWYENGYFHAQAPNERKIIRQLPKGVTPIAAHAQRWAPKRGSMRETDDSSLRQLPGSGPDFTNASINRNQAMRMMKAGMSPTEIAKAFPKVFSVDSEGYLGQKYDTIYVGSGRKETKYTILKSAVDEVIREFKSARPRAARSRPSEARRSAHHRRAR